MIIRLALALITLTGPNGQRIDVNPSEVVSVREPRGGDHLDNDIHCLLHTADGKFVAVVESCEAVRKLLIGADQE